MTIKLAEPGDVVRLSAAYGRDTTLTHVAIMRETVEVAGITPCHNVINVTRRNDTPDEILPRRTAVTCLICVSSSLRGGRVH
jgi:hypothetical protein